MAKTKLSTLLKKVSKESASTSGASIEDVVQILLSQIMSGGESAPLRSQGYLSRPKLTGPQSWVGTLGAGMRKRTPSTLEQLLSLGVGGSSLEDPITGQYIRQGTMPLLERTPRVRTSVQVPEVLPPGEGPPIRLGMGSGKVLPYEPLIGNQPVGASSRVINGLRPGSSSTLPPTIGDQYVGASSRVANEAGIRSRGAATSFLKNNKKSLSSRVLGLMGRNKLATGVLGATAAVGLYKYLGSGGGSGRTYQDIVPAEELIRQAREAQKQQEILSIKEKIKSRDPQIYQGMLSVASGRPPVGFDLTDNEVRIGASTLPVKEENANPQMMEALLGRLRGT